RFKGEFADVGKALDSARNKYEQVATTRYKQIDRLTTKINSYQLEQDDPPQLIEAPLEVIETLEVSE
ncbi:MAG TPA: hypothetical protein VGE59_05165, partial [Patescibacteria group bacterium]